MSVYTLRDINEMIYNLQQLIQDGADEETIQAFLDTKEMFELERDIKLEGYAMVIKNLESDNAGIKAEEERLAKRRKHSENAIARMKRKMEETLEMVEPDDKGVKRVKIQKFTFSFRKSSKVEVSNIDRLPQQYVKVERTIIRAELSKALRAGEHIEGAKLIENQSLSIR